MALKFTRYCINQYHSRHRIIGELLDQCMIRNIDVTVPKGCTNAEDFFKLYIEGQAMVEEETIKIFETHLANMYAFVEELMQKLDAP